MVLWTYLSFQFQMNRKELEISEFEMHLKKFFLCSNHNDAITSAKTRGLKMGMDFRGQVGKRVKKMFFFLV